MTFPSFGPQKSASRAATKSKVAVLGLLGERHPRVWRCPPHRAHPPHRWQHTPCENRVRRGVWGSGGLRICPKSAKIKRISGRNRRVWCPMERHTRAWGAPQHQAHPTHRWQHTPFKNRVWKGVWVSGGLQICPKSAKIGVFAQRLVI